MEQRRQRRRGNSNVSKILPLTTLRTIDLGGKKNSGPLFSRSCRKMRVFLRQVLHQNLCSFFSSRIVVDARAGRGRAGRANGEQIESAFAGEHDY